MQPSAGALARGSILVALGSAPLLLHVALAATGGSGPSALGTEGLVDLSLVAACGIPHTLAYSALLTMFGVTLLPGREPVITALARKMHDTLSGEMVRYTRGVTWAWSCFFAAQLLTSLALFLLAPIAAWSLFVNVLNLPLIVLMFAAERPVRRLYLRDPPCYSLSEVIGMVRYVGNGAAKRIARGGRSIRRIS